MSGARVSADDVERVYASHYHAFCRMATAVTGDAESGRDAVQEGFARALAGLDAYRGDGPLPAWAWRIVLRVALDRRRADAREGPQLVADVDAWSPALPHPERDPALADALAALPAQQRLIVFLRYFADLSHVEVAELAGVEPGTVSATLAQAKAALARRLALDPDPESLKEEAR
jgi:RNA polymerase sigma-70 factor (ECF subfamily)